MATAKKQASKPVERTPKKLKSAAVVVLPKKLTRKEKSIANKAAYAKNSRAVQLSVKALRSERIADWPLKPEHLQGKDDPDLPTDRGTKVGRPSVLYTGELDETLFELLCIGTSLDVISTLKGTPGLGTMVRWLSKEDHPFNRTFMRARSLVPALYEDRAMAVALNVMPGVVRTNRQVLDKDGTIRELEEKQERDNVERAKLAFGAYTWALGWMMPKKHGKLPDLGDTKKNEQLESLFASLKSGPVESQ